MIERREFKARVSAGLKRSAIVALLGPRQCGKTTLARTFLPMGSPHYFDLEDPVVAELMHNPMTALSPLEGLIVIDEIQRRPEIFPILRVLVDRPDNPATFLILGSASPELSRQASESLAGRVEIVEMGGFSKEEVGAEGLQRLWLRGGFPRSYLAESEGDSFVWRKDFVRTFLERDLGVMGFGMTPAAMGRFWTMVSHYHGQLWNGSEIAAALGVAPNTARAYLDALEQTYMIRRLHPWYANLGKRLVKSPKLYLRDSGIFHVLQGIRDEAGIQVHPKIGASWEGFVVEEVLRAIRPDEAYFYAVHSGVELDLLLFKEGARLGVEIKRADAPKLTRSMKTAMDDLELDELWVIYPGERSYALERGVMVKPLGSLSK